MNEIDAFLNAFQNFKVQRDPGRHTEIDEKIEVKKKIKFNRLYVVKITKATF